MSVYGIDGGSTVIRPKGTADQLGQTDFLKLMTAQLKAQDPFDPVDNSQMVAQMAQFSATTGIVEMNQSLKAMAADLASSRLGDVASWIGRVALVESPHALPLSDGSYAGEITLPSDATGVSMSYVNSDGTIVHSQTLGPQAAGSFAFEWDGKDAEGNAIPGPLKLVASATTANGMTNPTTSTWTSIAGVQSPAGGGSTMLVTPLGLIAPTGAKRLI